jgi:hypothetical protein
MLIKTVKTEDKHRCVLRRQHAQCIENKRKRIGEVSSTQV